jgi:hypothetical protein
MGRSLLSRINMVKNKLGVSGMISYVLLIGIVMAIGGFMFLFLRSYVPIDELKCPDGASIAVLNINCVEDSGTYNLSFELKNTGKFDLYGYGIYGDTSGEEGAVATLMLGELIEDNDYSRKLEGTSRVYFKVENGAGIVPRDVNNDGAEDVFEDGVIYNQVFEGIGEEIHAIDITPIMMVENDKNREIEAHCSEVRIREIVNCG